MKNKTAQFFLTLIFMFPLLLCAEQTLTIIKPDAVKENHIGDIIARFEKADLWVAAIKMLTLNKDQAVQFYTTQDKTFDPALLDSLSAGPIVVMVLQGYNAVQRNKELIGAPDHTLAKKGTIRADFGDTLVHNAVYGSGSLQAAATEITYFFTPDEIQDRNRSI